MRYVQLIKVFINCLEREQGNMNVNKKFKRKAVHIAKITEM